MKRLHVLVFAALFVPAYAQVACVANVAVAPTINVNGGSELTGDLALTCNSTAPPASTLINVSLFLNVPLTSHLTNAITMESEALLLIDEPHPGVPNSSNGFPYFGQVLGTGGALAGSPGSGNVYQGKQVSGNEVVWTGVPFVTSGPRIFRLTNIRADAAVLGAPATIFAEVAITGPVSVSILNPVNPIAFSQNGMNFTTTVPASPAGEIDLHFDELFPTAFLKRLENTLAGPLAATHQDVPGLLYCTESGFTPEFSAVTPGAIGSANTGTRLLAKLSSIPSGVFILFAPNEVTSTTGQLVAHRVFPPFAPNFTGGTVSTFGGYSIAPVSGGHTAELLYEVTAAAPYQAINGCAALDKFIVRTFAYFPVSMAGVNATGHLAPVDPTATASATAPEPRFAP